MAKRRKVGNLLALALLATVVERPMHPYEMAALMRARGKDEDMPIKWGSLYRVVQNLEKHGLLQAVESGRQGAMPERTVYRITAAGREELEDWARELVSTPEPEQPRFEAGLSVLALLEPDDAARLLELRVAALERLLADQRDTLARERREVPRLFLLEREYALAAREAELAWSHALLGDLTDGTFPGLEQWRDFHGSGRVPPELARLAEKGRTSGD